MLISNVSLHRKLVRVDLPGPVAPSTGIPGSN